MPSSKALGAPPSRLLKSVVFRCGRDAQAQYVVCLLAADRQVDMAGLAAATGVARSAVALATPDEVLDRTGVRGLMIGRGCIRNPWLFDQIRAHRRGGTVVHPTGREVLQYIEDLWRVTEPPESRERLQVEQMKRYLNFIGQGVGSTPPEAEAFLHRVRRTTTRDEFFGVCRDLLDHGDPMPLRPHPAVAAAKNEVECVPVGS